MTTITLDATANLRMFLLSKYGENDQMVRKISQYRNGNNGNRNESAVQLDLNFDEDTIYSCDVM